MKKEKLKRLGALSLMSLITAAGSGFAVYGVMNVVSDKKEDNNNQGDYDIPSLDDNKNDEETPFSKTVNSLMNSKELSDGEISLTLKPDNGSPIILSLSEMDVDLSKLNTSIVNISSDLKVQYGAIDQRLGLRIEGNEYCYIEFKGKKVVFNAPQTISDLMDMLKAIGILVPSTDSQALDVNLSELLNQLKDMVNDIVVGDETIIDEESSFDITIPDIDISDVKIASLKLRMTADKNTYSLKKIETLNDILIQKKKDESYETVLSLGLNGGFSLKDVSSYQEITQEQKKEYKTITQANGNVFSMVSSIIGNGSDIDLKVSLDTESGDSSKESKHVDIDGLIQAKIEKSGEKFTSSDFAKGSYSLKLEHLSSDKTEELNSLYAYHKNDTTYLRFNDLLKAKVTNTTLDDFFKVITEGTGKDAFEVISSQVNTTLGSLDFEKLKNNDLSQIQEFINADGTYFDFDESTSSFLLSLDGTYFGLTSTPIVIKVTCSKDATSESENGIKEIKIEGLNFKSEEGETKVSVSLTPKKLSSFEEIEDSEYSDFKGTVPLFSTICGIIGKRQFKADYSLSFNDRILDGSENNYNSIFASGSIGADLSKEGENKEKLLRSFEDGTYYLSMKTNTAKGDYTHNLDMTYQDKNLYFGYDSLNKSDAEKNVSVFKNYISNAQLGQMKDLMSEKTNSNVGDVFFDVDDVLSALGISEEFQSDIEKIKSGSLKGLDSVLSIKAEDVVSEDGEKINVISLTINTDVIFESNSLLGKNIGKIVLSLNSKEDGTSLTFKDIKIDTVISSDQEFSFTLSFKDYEDPRLTKEELSLCQEIKDFNTFAKAFYNLGTDLKKYGVKIDAQYKKNPVYEDGQLVSDNEGVSILGSAYWDLENMDNPKVGGGLTISHPYISINNDFTAEKVKADQTIKFRYQNNEEKDGQFTADYNDHMHILMNSSSVSDIVKTVSTASKTNLLNSLLDNATNIATGMPIVDCISQRAPSLLLDYPYVKKVEFDDVDNKIVLKVDKRLFNIDEEGDEITLSISYSDNEKPTLTSIKVDLSKQDELLCYASIQLTDYKEESLPEVFEYNEANKDKFVDLNGMSNLTKMMIDTTEFNYFHFSGFFDLDLSLFASNVPINIEQYSFDLNLDASIAIVDNEVNAYISLKVGDEQLEEAGYYVTEYAFKENKVYVSNTRTDAVLVDGEAKKQISTVGYRITQDEFKNNALYYLVSLGLDMDDRIAGKTVMANLYKSLADKMDKGSKIEEDVLSTNSLTEDLSINLSSDFSSLINSGALYNKDKQKFTLGFNFNSLISLTIGKGENQVSLIDFDNTFIKLYHQSKTNADGTLFTPFYAFQLSTDVNVLEGLAKASIRGQIKADANRGDLDYVDGKEASSYLRSKQSMARFYALTDGIDSKMVDDYSISSFDIHTKKSYDFVNMQLIDFANDYSLSDNGKNLSFSVIVDSEEYSNLESLEYSFLICR